MRLYLLQPFNVGVGTRWDPMQSQPFGRVFGFVIRAETEVDARKQAARTAGDEGSWSWRDPAQTRCEPLTPEGEAGVILRNLSQA